jgi:hypothetical protein
VQARSYIDCSSRLKRPFERRVDVVHVLAAYSLEVLESLLKHCPHREKCQERTSPKTQYHTSKVRDIAHQSCGGSPTVRSQGGTQHVTVNRVYSLQHKRFFVYGLGGSDLTSRTLCHVGVTARGKLVKEPLLGCVYRNNALSKGTSPPFLLMHCNLVPRGQVAKPLGVGRGVSVGDVEGLRREVLGF